MGDLREKLSILKKIFLVPMVSACPPLEGGNQEDKRSAFDLSAERKEDPFPRRAWERVEKRKRDNECFLDASKEIRKKSSLKKI